MTFIYVYLIIYSLKDYSNFRTQDARVGEKELGGTQTGKALAPLFMDKNHWAEEFIHDCSFKGIS